MKAIPSGDKTVFRPLTFYVSHNKVGNLAMASLIRKHGGRTSRKPPRGKEHIISLIDPLSKPPHPSRAVYSIEFITKSVEQGRLLDLESFRLQKENSRGTMRSVRLEEIVDEREAHPSNPPIREPYTSAEREDVLNGVKETRGISGPEYTANPTANGGGAQEDGNATPREEYIGTAERAQNQISRGTARRKKSSSFGENTIAGTAPNTGRTSGKGPGLLARSGSHRRGDGLKKAPLRPIETEEQRTGSSRNMLPRHPLTSIDSEASSDAPALSTSNRIWSSDEDGLISTLLMEAKESLRSEHKDPAKAYILSTWVTFEEKNCLPADRRAEECWKRAQQLWKCNSVLASDGRSTVVPNAKRKQGNQIGVATELTGVGPSASVLPGTSANNSTKQRKSIARETPDSGTATGSGYWMDKEKTKIRKRIDKLVSFIAKKGKVSERSAFRALRAKGGNWKSALTSIIDSK